MTEKEPQLFKDWSEYAKQRQVMASATLFKSHGWYLWKVGHAKLYGILLWHYETKKQTSFKYCKILKKEGYRRTHNYRMLKMITEKELLQKDGGGYYSIATSKIRTLERVISLIKKLDMIGNENEVKQKSENTALSGKTTKKNAKKRNAQ